VGTEEPAAEAARAQVLAVLAAAHLVLLGIVVISGPVADQPEEPSLTLRQSPRVGRKGLLEQTEASTVPEVVQQYQMIEARARVRRQWPERYRGLGSLRPRYPI
jgi:hypothetical protein